MATKRYETVGDVVESLPNNLYRVRLKNDHMLLCSIVYKMTKRRIKVVPGDTVTVEVTPTDLSRGRIVYRGLRKPPSADGEQPPPHAKPPPRRHKRRGRR